MTPATTRTDDPAAFAAALEFERAIKRRACPIVERVALGEVFRDPELPRVWVHNMLHVDVDADEELDANGLVATLDALFPDVPHRRAFVDSDAVGGRVGADLRARGWHVERDVFMALLAPRDRPPAPGLAREVSEPALRAVEAATMREERHSAEADVARQLLRAHDKAARGTSARFFVAAANGVDASHATLYSDGRIAQIEDVATLTAYRGRGLARAVVSAATDAALQMGHELVFIVASDGDWPKELYARLGFRPVGWGWGVTRVPDP